MIKTLFLSAVLLSTAGTAAHADAFCDKTAGQLRTELYTQPTRFYFQNDGGLLDGGTCWWHSRFQRAAQLLIKYRPDLPKPDTATAKVLIKKIRWMMGVVEVPGYSTFEEFSRDFQPEIQARLNAWQLFDGFILQRWIVGLQGGTDVDPSVLQKTMQDTYDLVENKNQVAFLKIQYPGVTAHAWLAIGVDNKGGGEWMLQVIDSNDPQITRQIPVHATDRFINIPGDDPLVPYLNFNTELKRMVNARDTWCGRPPTFKGVKPARASKALEREDEYILKSARL